MNRFKKYIKECRECVDVVDKAVRNGAVLTEEEKLDYYFKSLCNYRVELKRLISDRTYKVAYFYSKVMKMLTDLSVRGYTNQLAEEMFKKLNRMGFLCNGKCADSIVSEDENGSLYITVDVFDIEDEGFTYKVQGIKDLAFCLVDFTSFLMEYGANETAYINDYMQAVLSDVNSGISPNPYTNMEEDKMLSSMLTKNSNIVKLLDFDYIGGKADGRRNGGDSKERRAVAGI